MSSRGSPRRSCSRGYDPNYRERIASMGAEPDSLPPREFAALIRKEADDWGHVVRSAGVKVE